MRTIYLDYDFKCHLEDDGEMIPFETAFFDGKCDAFVEGYRIVPEGMMWRRFDGEIFHGEMFCPWKPYHELEEAQRKYEKQKNAVYEESLKVMGVVFE